MRRLSFIPLLFLSLPALAAEAPETDSGTFTLQIENDAVADTDRHYTNGIRLGWVSAEGQVPGWVDQVAGWVPTFPEGGKRRAGIAVGQSMFTPSDIDRVSPDADDQPYAGWLYAGVGLVSDDGHRIDNFELDLGVVGPSAQAAWTQREVHRRLGVREPRGWDAQLEDEPGVVLYLDRKWRSYEADWDNGLSFQAMPQVGMALGNVYTYAAAGGSIRFGDGLSHDDSPPRIRPSLPGAGFYDPPSGFGWYLFAGVEARAVARNIFLDGNSFRSGSSVDKLPLTGDLQAGLTLLFPGVRVTYTQVQRAPEFKGQGHTDRFGALSLSFNF